MQQMNKAILLTLFLWLSLVGETEAGWLPWSEEALITLDGKPYSADDFTNWWVNWQEKDMPFPESPDPYIDWLLLASEGERMKLYESPEYQKKVHTFLKARTLMYLKSEEIDSQIEIDDDALWQQYETTHAPQYQLNIFFFNDKEKANSFVEKYQEQAISSPDHFSTSHGREDGYFSQRTEWYRPVAVHAGWIPIIVSLPKGGMSAPVPWQNDFVVLRLQDIAEGSKNDFIHLKKQLREIVWKKEEARLTRELLLRLRKKYNVQVDEEKLEQLDIETAPRETQDTPLIHTDNGNISARIVVAKIQQVQRFRRQNGFPVENDLPFKKHIVNGIIDQTLTSWEALARKYEDKQPFKATYRFYCQHRLTRLLEEKLFIPGAQVTEEEIADYYNKNISLFTRPEIIRMAIIEGTEKGLNDLWLEAALGGDFLALARKRTGHDIPIRDIPANHLHSTVKKVINQLTKNEVSRPFIVDNHMTVVQLIERKPQHTLPLPETREDIKTALTKTKLDTLRREYLARLKQQYSVEINTTAWQTLQKEMKHDD